MSGSPADARLRWIERLDVVGLAANGVGVVVLLAYLVGSMIFTGGQMTPSMIPDLPQVMDWPLFTVPAWVSITIAAVGLLAFVPMTILIRAPEAGRLVGAFSLTVAGSCLQSFLMMWAFPIIIPASNPILDETRPGLHWIGLALGGLTILAILGIGARAITAADRARRGAATVPPDG